MKSNFDKIPQCFNVANPVVLVINQINIHYVYSFGKTPGTGKKEELEMNISLDYFTLKDNSYTLVYRQYYSHKHNVLWEFSATNGVSMTFSKAIESAFEDFDKQLKLNKPLESVALNENDFKRTYKTKPVQEVNKTNLKEGIYLSCKDIYLNKPMAFKDYVLKDSSDGNKNIFWFENTGMILNKSYAIVRGTKIFIHFDDNWYKEAVLADDGKLYYSSKNDNSKASKKSIDYETGN